MARREKTGTAEDLMSLVAMLPWWAGVLMAALCYLLLHHVANQPVAAALQTGQLGAMAAQTLWKTAASFGQYILPIICLSGAGLSAWNRHQRKTLVSRVVRSEAADALAGMSWQQFENLVGEAFRMQGYSVIETGGGGADGGVDLVIAKNGDKFVVQCKQWKAFKVGVGVVRELYGVMAAKGSAGGFVVTSGRFTEEASRFASGRSIALIDGPELTQLLRLGESTAGRQPRESSSRATTSRAERPVTPACPLCAAAMVRRVAKRGTNAGAPFWGCATYPTCKGTRTSTDASLNGGS